MADINQPITTQRDRGQDYDVTSNQAYQSPATNFDTTSQAYQRPVGTTTSASLPTSANASPTSLSNTRQEDKSMNNALTRALLGGLLGATLGTLAGALANRRTVKGIDHATKGVGNAAKTVAGGFNQAAKGVGDAVKSVTEGVSYAVVGGLAEAVQDTAQVAKQSVESASDALGNVADNVNYTLKGVGDAVKDTASDVKQSVDSTTADIKSSADQIGDRNFNISQPTSTTSSLASDYSMTQPIDNPLGDIASASSSVDSPLMSNEFDLSAPADTSITDTTLEAQRIDDFTTSESNAFDYEQSEASRFRSIDDDTDI